jgi:hypothetical protein
MQLSGGNLIFLISQPRAGSTMLQRVLAGHPEVHTTAEPWLMLHPVYALRREGHEAEYDTHLAFQALERFLNTLGGREYYVEALRRMATYLYGTACQQAGKTYFLDKTPRYFFIIPDLLEVFPDASYVILLRNPLAVLASILNTWVKGDWLRLSNHYENLVLAPKLLVEGISLLGSRAIVEHYEAFVQSPIEETERLCARLGLTFDVNMLEYGQRQAPQWRFGDPSGVREHVRPTASSLHRWLGLGQSRQTRHLAQEYLASLGPGLLAEMGYDYDELETRLLAEPCTCKGVVVSWAKVFAAEHRFRDKVYLLIVEFLQQRRVAHLGKQLAKLFLGRL